jgi:aldehyde:ferredoxin oxidoreductase
MGSKNLKALSVMGTGGIEIVDETFFAEAERLHKSIRDNPTNEGRRALGTARSLVSSSENSTLPTNNFRSGTFAEADHISAETMNKRFWKKRKACFACPTNCSALGALTTGKRKGTVQEGVDYENLGMLGSDLLIDDLEEIIYMNYLCDDLGLDTISTGNIIGFLMECTEKNISPLPFTIPFGDSAKAIEIIHAVAQREKGGDVLAEGLKTFSETLPQEAREFAMHVKGLELPAWEIRSAIGMGLAYATADRGGCHRRAFPISYEVRGKEFQGHQIKPFSPEHKAVIVKQQQDTGSVHYSLIVCGFCTGLIDKDDFFTLTNMATGLNFNETEFWGLGERVWNLVRLYNVREGITRADDTLPERFFTDPLHLASGKENRLKKEDFTYMLDQYYELRGWDNNGIPTEDTIKKLGLKDFMF